jgi:hypothetical protein
VLRAGANDKIRAPAQPQPLALRYTCAASALTEKPPVLPHAPPFLLWLSLFVTASSGLTGCASVRPAAAGPVWAADSATVKIAAGAEYARGASGCFFWGAHYRDVWATPVTVPVMHLATAVPGGLVPLQAGGSYQSKTLRLRAPNGREYVLRSVDKDASKALPTGIVRGLLGGVMKDQTSASLPYGAYLAARLAAAAGVYHTNPRLVFLADDRALGQFRQAYAHALYLLEERPDGDQTAVASFGRSAQVVSSAHMLTAIHRQPSQQVAARAYLRARLLDSWLGDWSRREDQWRWASFATVGGGTEYRPIPRDRDQAFFRFDDGVLTWLISCFRPRFQTYRAHLRPGHVDGLTAAARNMDRTLLASLSEQDFQQEADSLQRRLSDAALRHALAAGPPETQLQIAAAFLPIMQARRAQLPAIAQQFYGILAREAWLIGTDAPERFILRAEGPNRVRVQVLALAADSLPHLLSEQTFDVRHTRRLDLFGLGGDDVFELHGPLRPGFAIGLHGGNGHDRVEAQNTKGSAGLTWYTSSNPDPEKPLDVRVKVDPDKTMNYNAASWLERYRLDD